MSFTIERPTLFERTIVGIVPADQVDARLRATVQKLSREVQIRGFRPGKVPPSEIEKRFWEHITGDLQSELVNDVMTEVEKDEAMTILLEPELDAAPVAKATEFRFTLKLTVRPRIDVQGLDQLQLKLQPLLITDDDVDATVRQTREQYAEKVDLDVALDIGLLAEIDATVMQGDQHYLGPIEKFDVELGKDLIAKGFDEQLVGLKAGEQKDFTLAVTHDEHTHELACHVQVHKVMRRVLPELDAAFLEKVGFDSVDDFRSDVRDKLATEAEANRRQGARDEVMTTVLAANPLEVPQPIIERHVELAIERFRREMQMYGRPADEVEGELGGLHDRFAEEAGVVVRRQVVIDSLVKLWDVAVDDADMQEHFRTMAEKTGMNVARIRALYDDKERLGSLKGQLLQEKVLDRLLELAVENQAKAASESGAVAVGEPDAK